MPFPDTVVIAGGVGGAKLVAGFAAIAPPQRLTVIGNVADDEVFHGLYVSPDIDTLTYTLAGIVDSANGWGIADDSVRALAMLRRLRADDTWMQLGDADLGVHIYRSWRRQCGDAPQTIADTIAKRLGVQIPVVLPTEDRLATQVLTDDGWLPFQQYFVRERCVPPVYDVRIDGIATARATDAALQALLRAELIVLAPSNPIVSIAPIIDIPEIRRVLQASFARRIAVSPLVAGRALKGPTLAMLAAKNIAPTTAGIATCYADVIDTLIVDHADADDEYDGPVAIHSEATVMQTSADKASLARAIIAVAQR